MLIRVHEAVVSSPFPVLRQKPTPVTVNGVVLEQGPTATITAAYTRTSRQGYGYTIADTRTTMNIAVHAGNDPAGQADGSSAGVLRDMIYHAAATYTSNTTVDFAGAAAQYVKLTISSNWGSMVKQYGLSEVRFLQIPVVAAYPSPAAGAVGVAPHVALSWRPGREAGTHQVFLGTDAANLPLVATTNAAAYETDLGLGQTYYWKVVEVNEAKTPSTWEGPVWSFTTAKSVAVEDFESYNDRESQGTRIYETWIDGFGTQTNGAQVGYLQAPFAEQTIVFGGEELRIGTSYGTTEYMRGAIDDVRIYNMALSEAQIASLAGRPGPVFQTP